MGAGKPDHNPLRVEKFALEARTAVAVAPGAGAIFSLEGGSFVSIVERTSDNEVRVRRKRFPRCTAGFPYVVGFIAVPALPADRLCQSADTGGGGE